MGSALVDSCYVYSLLRCPCLLRSYKHVNLKIWSRKCYYDNLFSALLVPILFSSLNLISDCSFSKVSPLSSKQAACRKAYAKISLPAKNTCAQLSMEMRRVRPLPTQQRARSKYGEQLEVWTTKPLRAFQNRIQNFTLPVNLNLPMVRRPVYLLIFLMPSPRLKLRTLAGYAMDVQYLFIYFTFR
jgi:hypothetical protein